MTIWKVLVYGEQFSTCIILCRFLLCEYTSSVHRTVYQLKSKSLNVFCLFLQRLKSQSTKYRTDRTYTTKEAEKQDNVKKNRYKDIVPCTLSKLAFPLLHGMINNIVLEVKQGSVTL